MRRKLSSTITSTTVFGPTAERLAKAHVLKPALDLRAERRAYEVVDVIATYSSRIAQEAVDALRHYTDSRIEVETATMALASYEHRVDHEADLPPEEEIIKIAKRRITEREAERVAGVTGCRLEMERYR